MIGSCVVLKRTYNKVEIISALFIVFGLVILGLEKYSNNIVSGTGLGYLLLVLSLIGDALVGNLQQKMMNDCDISSSEMVYL